MKDFDQINDRFKEYIDDLDLKFDNVMKLQEQHYQRSVISFVQVKEQELKKLMENLKAKNNSLSSKDKDIVELKQMILICRRELFEADQKRVKT